MIWPSRSFIARAVGLLHLGGALGCITATASAQEAIEPAEEVAAQESDQGEGEAADPEDEGGIVVVGESLRGRAFGGFQPEQVLTEEDIAAYGAGSLGELVGLLLAETSSGRGRSSGPPIVLINGRRVSGFREVGRYPVTAVARVEVLPEEASLAYGFAADQRVLNFVLKRNVKLATTTLRIGAPSEGGRTSREVDGQFLKVDGPRRLSLDGAFEDAGSILETDRDLVFSDGSQGLPTRTLAPSEREWSAGFSASFGLPAGSVATLSGSLEDRRSQALFGSEPITRETLVQVTDTSDIYTGLTVVSALAPSTWTLTASYADVSENTRTDLASTPGLVRQTELSRSSLQANALLNQRLADLAAGPLNLTASLDLDLQRQDAEIAEGMALDASAISRDSFGAGLSVNVPILAPAPIPGDFGLNGNLDLRNLSDFGWLLTYGYGLRWRPFQELRLLASVTQEEEAPTLNDLGSPIVETPGVRIFDFAAQDDALATLITGGNRDLISDSRRVIKISAQWNPSTEPRIGINVDYTNSRTDNEVRRFRLLTEDFEAAFPERVSRGASGELLSFDARPLQVARGSRDELRTSLTFSKRLKSKRERRRVDTPPAKRRRSPRPGSLRVTAVHRLTLRDEVRLGPNGEGPVLDLLNGASIENVGGTPRHQVDLSMYRWKYGFGFAAGARYQSGTLVNTPSGPLRFSDLATLGVRFTYEFNYSDAILAKAPFLEETLVAFNVNNLFNQRQRVTDQQGNTPDNFLPELLDPFGRSIRLDIRKRF